MNITIIGGGISGIAAALTLRKAGHEVTVYEKSEQLGGVWSLAYAQVTLQNIGSQYHFSDFPWPFKPQLHPTGDEIRRYLRAAVDHFGLAVQLGHTVEHLEELPEGAGWKVTLRHGEETKQVTTDFVVSSIGQYTEGKNRPTFVGEEEFGGQIITERGFTGPEVFADRRVAVVGFGKSALDMTAFAGEVAGQVHHVFRTPRWTIPYYLLGLHYTHALFSRMGTVLMPSWVHPTKPERFVHRRLKGLVGGFWQGLAALLGLLARSAAWGKGTEAKRRVRAALPRHAFARDLRSATAMQPPQYFPMVAAGKVMPHLAEVERFTPQGLRLSTGEEIAVDTVVLSLGSQSPRFPFMPEKYRRLLEGEDDGVQLYRHLIHPDIPNFAFAGYNHGFMHVPAVEVGMVWLHAYLSGDLQLPDAAEMHRQIETVRQWKREHVQFEPSRSCAISTRFQQYLDLMLKELHVSPYRKKNPVAELFGRYQAKDYRGVYEEYTRKKARRTQPLQALPFAT